MSALTKVLIIYVCVLGFITFIMYGIDKSKAKHHKWRIPERVLLGMCIAGGVIGGWLGMYTFRHKTKHLKFYLVQSLAVLIWAILFIISFRI